MLLADYKVFVTKTLPNASGKEEEVFFGTWNEYGNAQSEALKSVAEHGTVGAISGVSNGAKALAEGFVGEGLKSAGAGLAIGVVVGVLDHYISNARRNQFYILVKKVSLSNGKVAKKAIMFIGDKNPELSREEIHEILKRK
jgi:hypothetical protein